MRAKQGADGDRVSKRSPLVLVWHGNANSSDWVELFLSSMIDRYQFARLE